MKEDWVIADGRQFDGLIAGKDAESGGSKDRLMEEDAVEPVLKVESFKVRQAVQSLEVVTPATKKATLRTYSQKPGVEVRAENGAIDGGADRGKSS